MLGQFLADPRHRFLPDDLSCAERVVRTDLMSGPNQITDRYLIALARQHGCNLATLDEPLAKSFVSKANLGQLIR
ncbi:MAG: PIN domain-containing protein [Verrucomicrobiota bacterium]